MRTNILFMLQFDKIEAGPLYAAAHRGSRRSEPITIDATASWSRPVSYAKQAGKGVNIPLGPCLIEPLDGDSESMSSGMRAGNVPPFSR